MKRIQKYFDRLVENKYFQILFCIYILGIFVYYSFFYNPESPERLVGPRSFQERVARSAPVSTAITSYCAEREGRNPVLVTRADNECREEVMPVVLQLLTEDEGLLGQIENCLMLEPDRADQDELGFILEKSDLQRNCVRENWPGGIGSLFD